MSSLSGLGNIDPSTIMSQISVIDDIIITDNPMLSVCEVGSICSALNSGQVTTNVMNNATGCDGNAEILTACQALPVEWVSLLKAITKNNEIEINFKTAMEFNNSHFEIEHSQNGVSFQKIGKIEAIRNTAQEKNYIFSDSHPSPGINYYRVKQVDLRGTYEYSNIASSKFLINEIIVFPNPVKDEINFKSEDNIAAISITDLSGKLVRKIYNSNQAIDVSDLSPGIYFLQIQIDETLLTEKIIKE